MTELTLLDWAALGLFAMLIVGGWIAIFDWLNKGDRRWVRQSQCPPHEWAPQYMDDPEVEGGHKYVGLRCGKCKRPPEGLSKGESWFGGESHL